MKNHNTKTIKIVFAGASIFLGISFFVWTMVPLRQLAGLFRSYDKTMMTGNVTFLTKNEKLFSPYTFVQPFLREYFLRMVSNMYPSIIDPKGELYKFAVIKLEESLEHNNKYANNYVILGKAYETLAVSSTDEGEAKKFYAQAGAYYEEALRIMPYYVQAVEYYALNLYNRGLGEASILLLQDALKQESTIYELNYFLGVIEAKQNEKYINDALLQMEIAFSHSYKPQNIHEARGIYTDFVKYFTKHKDKERAAAASNRLKEIEEMAK